MKVEVEIDAVDYALIEVLALNNQLTVPQMVSFLLKRGLQVSKAGVKACSLITSN